MECIEETIYLLPSVIQPERSSCDRFIPIAMQERLGAVMSRAYGYPHVIKERT